MVHLVGAFLLALPGAARAHETSLAFFVHPTVTDAEIHDAVLAVRKVMTVAAR